MSCTRAPRLYHSANLFADASVALEARQAHYVINVMRLRVGHQLRLFNGRDGEWLCTLSSVGKKTAAACCGELLARPTPPPDIDYLFAPLKSARLDYLAQKATEMGVRTLRPVITAHTAATRLNLNRLGANVIEAAEQCNLVWLPDVAAPAKLCDVISDWQPNRKMIFCDETAAVTDPVPVLRSLAGEPLAVLVGPEGGFDNKERTMLRACGFAVPISLGPRVMRADTAAVAALALVQTSAGDWRGA